jgi:hypothetical protein
MRFLCRKKVQVLSDFMYIPDPNPTGPKSCGFDRSRIYNTASVQPVEPKIKRNSKVFLAWISLLTLNKDQLYVFLLRQRAYKLLKLLSIVFCFCVILTAGAVSKGRGQLAP